MLCKPCLKEGSLRIQTLYEGNQVSLIIEDTGVGMSEEVLEKDIYSLFYNKRGWEGDRIGFACRPWDHHLPWRVY